jgi:RNA polymerase sigma-70 factor (ECF subfamily)
MNADALITSLGTEAAREEVMTELDRLLAAHSAGALLDDELSKLEARAIEQPEFRRTLGAYAPLGAEVEQRIVGALRGVLGREPSSHGRRSSTHDSDVMRSSSVLQDSSLQNSSLQNSSLQSRSLHDSALPSWGSLPSEAISSAGMPSEARASMSTSFESEARESSARGAVVTGSPTPRGTFERLGSYSGAGSYGGAYARAGESGVRASHDGFAGDERPPYTDRSACNPGPGLGNAGSYNPGPGGTFPVDGEEAFEQLLRQAYADGQLAWPTVKAGYEAFSLHVRRAVGKAPDWEWQIHAGDLYLCCACALGDRDATRLLDTQILPRAAKAIARIESDASFVDEALQILRHKLFVGPDAKISVYSGRGSLTAWLRVTATRVALDGLRAMGAQRAHQVDLQDRMAQPSVNPLNDLVKSRYAEAFQEALRSAIRELSVRDRNLLRLRLVGHCGIDQLGQMYRVHRATAARWLKAAHTRVFDSVREQLRARFQLSDDEFDQMALDMQSRLELSLSGLGVDGSLPLDGQAPAEPAAGDRATSERAISERATSEQATIERTIADAALSDDVLDDGAAFDPATSTGEDSELEHSRHVTRHDIGRHDASRHDASHEDDDLPRNGVSWSRD